MLKFLYLALIVLIYLFVERIVHRIIVRVGTSKNVRVNRIAYINKTIHIVLGRITVEVMILAIGVNYGELSIFVSSAFAVLGVALFAQWSILSNITASVLIFFGFPYRLGDRIRVVEPGDEVIEGEVMDINLFCITVKKDNQDIITYPNNLLLQRPVIRINSRTKNKELPACED